MSETKHTPGPFSCLYKPYLAELEAFGDYWCGPESYEHGEEVLVARYESSDEDDGQTVQVFCTPLPACFYTLHVLKGVNSIREPQTPWKVSLGSGQAQLAADIAEAVSTGMLGFYCAKAEPPDQS